MEGALFNHLWQSTVFAIAAWLITLALRQYAARTRYLIWLAVSLKFLIPLGVLVTLGLKLRPAAANHLELLPQPLVNATLTVIEPLSVSHSINGLLDASWGFLILSVWAAGVAIVLARWWFSWRSAQSLALAATPHSMAHDVEIRVSAELAEPSVFGIFRPTLLLPSAVVSRLSSEELDAVIAHELCHIRHRDNLTAAVHMLVEALFWYYPLVWWVGRQMLKERESACDETVVELGAAPRIYAEGILKACRLSLESRLGVMAGAGGSNLSHRVKAIVHGQPPRKLNPTGKAGLVAIGSASLILPVLTGFAMPLTQSMTHALSVNTSQTFKVTWVARTPPNSRDSQRLTLTPTHLSMRNTSLRKLISVASGLRERQVFGGPLWLDEHYDIEVDTTSSINRRMVLELLSDQFGLRFIERNLENSDEDPL